jgi:hypothetical protein
LRTTARPVTLSGMERTPTEWTLEELLPTLEAEHAAEQDDNTRDAIWALINSVEEYLLTRQAARRHRPV